MTPTSLPADIIRIEIRIAMHFFVASGPSAATCSFVLLRESNLVPSILSSTTCMTAVSSNKGITTVEQSATALMLLRARAARTKRFCLDNPF
jgi:hypothetical protein